MKKRGGDVHLFFFVKETLEKNPTFNYLLIRIKFCKFAL